MPPTPAQTFARLERAHAAWTRGGATIVASSVTPRGTTRAQFRLDLDGAGGTTLRIKTPPKGKLAATDQTYVLRRDGVLVGVDWTAREFLTRPTPSQGPLALRLTAVLGELDDSIGFLTGPEVRGRYLVPFRSLGGWKTIPNGLERRTTGAKASWTRLRMDAAGRLKTLHVEFPGSKLDWNIAYGPAKVTAIPRGLRVVEAFTARPRPPRYANARAQTVVERMLRASAGLKSAIVRIDGAATLWVDGSRVRYEGGGLGFAYDGRILTLVTPGVAYQGRSSRGAVIDQVATLLGSVDPMVRSILVRTPPYGELFTPEARVRVVGTMASGRQACDVLAIDNPRYRASMFVRKVDGLPASIETEALDRKGAAVSRTMRALAWSSVGTALPKSLFALRLRPGQIVLPLPKRKF